jgi:hypothetical protein
VVPAEREAEHDERGERRRLREGERVLDQLAELQAPRVRVGEQQDHKDGDELLRREDDGVVTEDARRDKIVRA